MCSDKNTFDTRFIPAWMPDARSKREATAASLVKQPQNRTPVAFLPLWRKTSTNTIFYGSPKYDQAHEYGARACVQILKLYLDPETFRPERFLKDRKLNPSVTDPIGIIFGYSKGISFSP
ncbi:hypothetical protein LXA43DRAFT_1060635 [Ganoderma leucocontextum]|nr:hypothetical protein LXA43DRAFT_1060635 [Ganoderma leucocontextum]